MTQKGIDVDKTLVSASEQGDGNAIQIDDEMKLVTCERGETVQTFQDVGS